MLEIIENIVEGRNNFFNNRSILRAIGSNRDRAAVTLRYMSNELAILETLNRVYINNVASTSIAAAIISIPIQNTNPSFSDPVRVIASPTQIENAIETADMSGEDGTHHCPICQEPISSNGVRLRQCHHGYHRHCITNWFSMSVRCPVCRYDIREEGPAVQTSPVAWGRCCLHGH